MFCLSSTSTQVTQALASPKGHSTLCDTGSFWRSAGRDGSGLQWQSHEEPGISLCFSKIAVCDADHEVKLRDVLWYGGFFILL